MGKRGDSIGSHELAPKNVKAYLLAGRAIVTVQNKETGNHFTYTVKKKEEEGKSPVWFVSVNSGAGELYIGMLTLLKFMATKKSAVPATAPSFQVFDIVVKRYVLGYNPHPSLKIMHNGECAKCGRTLTHPDSISSGLGPVCGGITSKS